MGRYYLTILLSNTEFNKGPPDNASNFTEKIVMTLKESARLNRIVDNHKKLNRWRSRFFYLIERRPGLKRESESCPWDLY